MNDLGDLADRLEAVLADIDDVAFDRLRTAVAEGATTRPASDKELAKVRRAVDKALHLLRRLEGDEREGLGERG